MIRETEFVHCPTCGVAGQVPLFQVNGWNISRCASCGLAMVNPRRKGSMAIYQDDRYFKDDDYYYDYAGNKSAYQKGFRSKLKLIARHCHRKGKLLDIGAAYGFFMEEAARYGFEPFGVELSGAAAQHAAAFGPVFHEPFAQVETTHRFAVVSFIDSLEHFEHPDEGLRKAWDLLEDHGIVAVMVPNIESLYARLAKTKWHLLLPEEHLFYFTPGSLRRMLELASFELVHMGSGGYGRSLAEILHVLLRGKARYSGGLDALLRNITFEINLGDLFAIARKVESGCP